MKFEEFISSVKYGCDADIVLARKAYDTAVEASACIVEQRGTAKDIRALSTNIQVRNAAKD